MRYAKVALPKELFKKIEELIEETDLGYRSVNEFVVDAVRRRVEELEKMLERRER